MELCALLSRLMVCLSDQSEVEIPALVLFHFLFSILIIFLFQGKHLVSVGGYIYLWDLCNRVLAAKVKASSSFSAVTSVSFSSDAKFIVTAGKKHLKSWAVGSYRMHATGSAGSLALCGKPVNLGPHKGSSFIDVSSSLWTDNCSDGHEPAAKASYIYALTDTGLIQSVYELSFYQNLL